MRHAAGSLLARNGTSVEVRDFMGHAKLSTTDRYVSARFSPKSFGRLDIAFDETRAERPAHSSTREHGTNRRVGG